MHVGYAPIFQNPGSPRPDHEVYADELRLAALAEPLGFDSVWSVEHHFTDYTMVPDVVQFLSYMAGKTSHIQLGSMAIILPWHDPLRVAEQVSMLDNLSGGRYILGIGRGLAKFEFEGFRLDMTQSRAMFIEYAETVLEGLEQGYVERDGVFAKQPRREIRPYPVRSFQGRTYAAGVSAESMPIMAKLGAGLLIIPQKAWDEIAQDMESYRSSWAEFQPGRPRPRPYVSGFTVVDSDADRAKELAHQYIGVYYQTVTQHYNLMSQDFAGAKVYDHYDKLSKFINERGMDYAASGFTSLMPWGTPDQVLRKIEKIRDIVDMGAFVGYFSFAGMPIDQAERSLNLFASEVLPVLKQWEVEESVPAPQAVGPAAG